MRAFIKGGADICKQRGSEAAGIGQVSCKPTMAAKGQKVRSPVTVGSEEK